jgi:hypothetical protein
MPLDSVYKDAATQLHKKINTLLSGILLVAKRDYLSLKGFDPIPLLADLLRKAYELLRKMRVQIVSEELEIQKLPSHWEETNDAYVSIQKGLVCPWELQVERRLERRKPMVLRQGGLG